MNEPYEPTTQDIDFLNQLEQGYIGLEKPRVQHIKFESNEIHINKARIEDGDNAPESPEQAGWDKFEED